MSLCQCSVRPRCQCQACTFRADWTVILPPWRGPARATFMCDWHYQAYKGPIPGIDRPEGADDDWKPTLGLGRRDGYMQELEKIARWATAMRDMRRAERDARES